MAASSSQAIATAAGAPAGSTNGQVADQPGEPGEHREVGRGLARRTEARPVPPVQVGVPQTGGVGRSGRSSSPPTRPWVSGQRARAEQAAPGR